jgi:endonuclease YncB( thermonuclease family)
MPAWEWPNSTIIRVIDGDTVIARLQRDIGFHGLLAFEQHLRLNRINTPPAKTPAGAAATAALDALVYGQSVHITTVKPYKYGDEWVAEIVLEDGRNVSDELVAAGVALRWDGTGQRPGG